MSPVRTYLMPIESSFRELDYKLMLAALLASPQRRFVIFRQDLGSKLVGPIRGGVWVGQHIRTRTEGKDDYSRLHKMKDAGFSVGFIDEEGAVFHGDEEEWKKQLFVRLDPTKLGAGDVVCTWGTFQEGTYRAAAPKVDVVATGHPRFDLCRAPYSGIYEERVETLRREFGGHVLINTNFGLANYITGLTGLFNRKDGYRPEEVESRLSFVANWRRALETFGEFIEAVHRLSARHPKHTFVLRPHPIEDHEAYRRLLAGLDNVKVIHSGGVIPWLRSASVVVHNGCTTALEAHLAGAPVINYVPQHIGGGEEWVATLFGRRATNFEALSNAIGVADQRAVQNDPADPERVRRASSVISQLGDEGRDPLRAFAEVVKAIERVETVAGAPRFDELIVKTIGRGHAAGVQAKSKLGEAGRYLGRTPRAPRKFAPFDAADIASRVAVATSITGRPLRSDVVSATMLVLS